MKKIFNFIIAVAIVGLAVASCQNDDNNMSNTSSQSLSKSSPLTEMLMRVTHNNTGKMTSAAGKMEDDHNIPCFVVNLPVTLLVNGESITVSTLAGYAIVQNALHRGGGKEGDDGDKDGDNDHDTSVVFVFPITLTFADGTSQTVTSETELKTAIFSCSDDTDDIDCFEIHFPITISFNDADNVNHVITFNDKKDVYIFLVTLGITEKYFITYPLSVTNAAGTLMIINNNNKLLTAIKAADDHCGHHHDGDDDDDD